MKLGYTEFSFGYAFTENLIRSSVVGPKSAPIFPNLSQEGKVGYDVQISLPGLPLFVQYKLPELMTLDTAREIAKFGLRGIKTPFFRMPLMPTGISQQHALLINLEKKYPGTVLYASPLMRDGESFNGAYTKLEVHRRSIFFSPSEIGPLPDNKGHSIAYREGLSYAWLCSEPKQINAIGFEVLEGRTLSLFHNARFLTLQAAASELRGSVRSIVSDPMREAEHLVVEQIRARRTAGPELPAGSTDEEQVLEDILVAREMVRIDLGLDLSIAQPRATS